MRQRNLRQDRNTDFSYHLLTMVGHVSDAAKGLRELRDRAGYSRAEIGRLIGMPATTYQGCETEYKRPFQPVTLMKALVPHLVGRGDPPITNFDLATLAGADVLHPGDYDPIAAHAMPAEELASGRKQRIVIPKLDPAPGDPIHDLDEAALLGMWRRLSIVKKATLFAHLGSDDMPSLRKSA